MPNVPNVMLRGCTGWSYKEEVFKNHLDDSKFDRADKSVILGNLETGIHGSGKC